MNPFAEPELSLADRIRLSGREIVGAGDAALTMGKNIAVQPVAGWRAMADLLRGHGVKNAVKNAERFQERVAGGPKTPEGARQLENVGDALKTVTQPFSDAADWIGERSPVLGGVAMAGAAAVDPSHIKSLAKGLRGAVQKTLPGIKGLTRTEQAFQNVENARRALNAKTDLVNDKYSEPDIGSPRYAGPHTIIHPDVPTDEGHEILELARRRLQAARGVQETLPRRLEAEPQWARMEELRGGLRQEDDLAQSLARQEELLRLKTESPIDAPGGLIEERAGGILNIPEAGRYGTDRTRISPEADSALQGRMDQRRDTRQLVRQLRGADERVNKPAEQPSNPAWAVNAAQSPLQRGNGPLPADESWWYKELNVPPPDPNAAPESVAAFLRAAKDQPEIFQFGGMPEGISDIEDFAKVFGDRAGKRIRVDREYNDGYSDEPYKIEVEKTHGRGEYMRDRYGDYKTEPKEHDPGDYPMYDEFGEVKKTNVGTDAAGDPIMRKRRAMGGEPWRDEHGDQKYRDVLSEGGEPMRDERGRQKYKEKKNPDYEDGEPVDKVTLSVPGEGHIEVDGWDSDEPMTTATGAGTAGALMYQTLLAHASKNDISMGVAGLTHDNQLRLLSNALANAARTGTNPRDVTGTLSGRRPAARGYAPGDRIWQALAGEADARIAGKGGDPHAIGFTPESFTHRGQPISAQDIHDRIEEFSPEFTGRLGSKVGPKTVMQNAVFKWLENASPEQAEQVARDWPKRFGKPLFSAAGAGVGTATLADLLRQDQEAQN